MITDGRIDPPRVEPLSLAEEEEEEEEDAEDAEDESLSDPSAVPYVTTSAAAADVLMSEWDRLRRGVPPSSRSMPPLPRVLVDAGPDGDRRWNDDVGDDTGPLAGFLRLLLGL